MQTADYSLAELATALSATIRVITALDATGPRLDVVDQWQEQAEAMATHIAEAISSREAETEEEGRIQVRALAAYAALIMQGDDADCLAKWPIDAPDYVMNRVMF
ncbi:hypothetical protein FE840_001390 [Peteryoungia desertarenae]|uniref:Phage gp6-like head-tail connector protein n=1 Tax=Peteryoungia desertarenae TaxID=1813451 RepID=A0ABX6QIB9_9HYPH|nr:hypothetical protein [Peteryoungia desertarenae]QLF68313.1 hypothetical protein FE840_001390 [Peteryoungia desertarenae]